MCITDNKPEIRISINRYDWVDALRTFALILVIYGHLVPDFSSFFVFTNPIKIPLFFAISGFLFNQERTLKDFVITIFTRLIVPWLLLSLIPALVLSPFRGIDYLKEYCIKVFSGEIAWYMPCCIIAESIWFVIIKVTRQHNMSVMLSALLFIIGVFLCKYNIANWLMINRAFQCVLFMAIGSLYKKYANTKLGAVLNGKRIILPIGLYILLGIIFIVWFPGVNLDIHRSLYYSYSITLVMIALGICIVFELSSRCSGLYPKLLLKIGRYTLPIYLLHTWILAIVRMVFKRIGIASDNYFVALIITTIVCGVTYIFSVALGKYVPFMIGKKRVIKES